MATRIRTLNFLPEVFKTNTNAQFLAATLDQLVQQPETRRIEGYIGSKFGYGINANDFYVVEPTKIRKDYQLDPGVVFTKTNQNTAQDFISYPGILDALKLEGGLTDNNNRLFASQFYSWDSFTNLDKLINYNQYYWIPEGPENVVVSSDTVFSANDYSVTPLPNGYNVVPVTAGAGEGSTNPTLTLLRGGTYTFAVNQDSQFWIQGAPGITGYSPTQPNLQTRAVYGVDNNGAAIGVVTFTVPPKDAQNEYNFPGNNLVDVVSSIPFNEINGKPASSVSIDGVTSLQGLTVMFYDTGIPAEVGYVSNFFDYSAYDSNNGLVGPQSIAVTTTTGTTNLVTCASTANLVVGNTVVFAGIPFGGLSAYSETLPSTLYYITSIINGTQFTISTTQPDISLVSDIELGEKYIITSLGTTDFTQCGASGNIVGIIFTASATGLGTGTARKLTSGQNFRIGETYTITSVGTTDFTTFGAASNTTGTVFTASGAGIVSAGSFVSGLTYQITTLGNTNWNTVAGTVGYGYTIGDIIVAAAAGSGTGQANQLTTGYGTGTAYEGATNAVLSSSSGSMTLTYNLGLFEEGYYTNVNENFYTITYVGPPSSPVIRLIPATEVPINEKITAVYGTQWISRNFYRNSFGFINLIPYISAPLDTLYYQDGTYENRVGIIRLIESNASNTLDVETDILGQLTFTSTNGVVFTNGLKVSFQGDVVPSSYLSGEYYVEGVGLGIELLPVENFISPEAFTSSTYDPWDILPWDSTSWEGNSYIPVTPDYITISRNSIDKNAWSRSNRWFHIDVINATATYNNNPNLITVYATIQNKAKRPIIEFYPNLKLFNSGVEGKNPVDFIDTRTTDAFSYVAGQQNYYPDIEVYTGYTATINSTNYTPIRYVQSGNSTTGIFTVDVGNNTIGFNKNDLIVFDDITPGSGFTPGGSYYVAEVVSGTEFKLSATKNGDVLIPEVSISGSYEFRWSPQSTTITIPASNVTGTLTVGQYVTDSTNVIPRNAQILSITGTTTLTLTLDWDEGSNYFSTQSNASLVAADTTVDNYSLFDGAKVVFTADTDDNVKNKIFVARLSQIGSASTTVITLTELDDGLCLPANQTVALRGYYNQGKEFWFDGIEWFEGQQKNDINQPPLFDVYDENNISFGDSSVYLGTSFTGCKLFAYGFGTGLDDSILGFPIRYSSVDNVGDISFDISLNADTFDYVQGNNPITQQVNTGYVFQYSSRTEKNRQIGWQTAVSPSVQYQIFQFNFDPLAPSLMFDCDISTISSSATQWPTVQVFVNNILLDTTAYTITIGPTNTIVTLNSAPVTETVIQILLLSNQTSKTAYYSIPINLNNNPFNADITVANVGDIRGQYQSSFYNNPATTGDVFGPNNFRDLGNMVPWGNKIIQNSASLALPGTFLRKQEHNLFNALMYNSREYVKFKNLLMYTIQNSDYEQRFSAATMLDDALDQITASKTDNQSFFWSDMLPNKAAYITNTYSFANSLDVSIYPLSTVYNFAKANYNGVLVYLTRTVNGITYTSQLVNNKDYTISSTAPSLTVTLDLAIGDIITIKEYTQTYGSYVPNTPTKLGLYPSYIPQVILDDNYTQPTYFIKGHDGSYTKLYGDYDQVNELLIDFRDQVLLEFELRIYNNLKLSSVIPIQEYEVVPGFFRNTDYTYDEWLLIYSQTFLNWTGQNRLNYKTQLFNSANEYTYNYFQSGNSLNKQPISQGYWRGIYQYFYDTTTPETTPWEMLGFTDMPSWWSDRYGPAPYTNDNLILWTDLENGVDWNNGNPIVIEKAVRPGLLDIIPVDSAGELLPPLSVLIGSYNERLFQRDWKVGDNAPVELSYRKSSSYPFDLVRLMALMKPAKFYNLAVDLDNYKYNEEFNQYLVNNRSHLKISDIEIYGNGIAKTSYINWIVDYEKQVGIDATTNITTLLDNLDVRLIYRLAGFSDKSLLKFYVEKGTPNSRNASLLIPDESYGVLLYDNQPFNRIAYSSVMLQRTNAGTFAVYGNSQTYASFTTLKPKFAGNYQTFEIEDAKVTITPQHFDKTTIVPYGTTFYSLQEVAQFLSDYGAYLTSLGMKFEELQNELTINWDQMISEFLYWAQNDWESGSTITLNPAAGLLKIEKDSNIVQPLTIQQSNFILNQNLYPISTNDLAITRLGVAFSAATLNQGDSISYGQFNLSNFEHGLVFDNVTVFGDVIYNLITGLRQTRISLRGTKSAAWDGTVNASGFIYNQDNIKEWNNLSKYTKGEIVKYKNKYWIATTIVQPKEIFKEDEWKRTDYDEIQKGLLPNPSTRSYESSLYYDIDKANLELDADQSSFSLIGYRPRDYMAAADLTDITQINVYKNMIKSKGTRDSTYAFKGAQLPQGGINYDIYENWAIKSGEFGGVLNNNFVEFKINEKYMTGNPSIVGLTDGVHNDGVQQEIPIYSIYNYGRPINDVDILPVINNNSPSTVYPDAGYVNFNDVKMSAFFYSQMPAAVNKNNILVPVDEFYVRDYAWVANFKERWEVFTPSSMGQIIAALNNLNETVTITFNQPHNLQLYDPLAIVNFDTQLNGYYIAVAIVDPYRILINKVLDPSIKIVTGLGVGLRLSTQRVATPAQIASLPLMNSEFTKNTVWVDEDTDGSWGVYRKSLNYTQDQQITKTLSESLGSAVAIGQRLGYLIGDADAGKVYRYLFNALSEQYDLNQTLSGVASFGSTIAYSDDIYVIAATSGSGYIRLYQLQNTTASDDLILFQTIATTGASFGSAIAFSGDQKWLYISKPDDNSVEVYKQRLLPTVAGYFVATKAYRITEIGTTDFTALGATSNDIGVCFVATSAGSGTGTATEITYEYVNVIDGDALGFTTAGDNFGKSISTDYYGDCVVIGTPNKDYETISNWGYSYVFDRVKQNIEVQNSTTPQLFSLAWTPTTLQKTVASTTAPNTVTLNNTSGLTVNDPIVFTTTGPGLAGTLIESDKVYYVNSIAGSTITIKESRNSSAYVVTTNASVTATLHVQTSPIFVYNNGSIVTDNNYAVINDSLLYTGNLNAGDIITVDGNDFTWLQTLTTQETPQTGSQFGISVDTNIFASEILVGAPFQLNSQLEEGAVYRYTDGGAKYGTIVGTGICATTTTRKLLINGFLTYIPAGNAETVANAIKSSNITNVTATATDGKLIISLIDTTLSTTNEKLVLSVIDTETLSELGITVFTKTQEILCPHRKGPTQFGTVVKFNEFGSFVASAPVGARYSSTTFDFTDDENQDNDTIFDNNGTQWVDTAPNFGAVYMFDYMSQYNESLANVGRFVYAQSVNSPNLVYSTANSYNQDTDITTSNQPRYGTALDFNEYGVIIGTPNDIGATTGTTYAGSVTTYENITGIKNWSLYRYSAPIVDINRIFNTQLFSAENNQTLINLDYIDPLQGKILGAARENIDIVSNTDPASYNNTETKPVNLVWGSSQLGKVWLDTSNMRYVNYHQNDDIPYNSQYWGTLFPGSDVAVYSWISSPVIPADYEGPGTPYELDSYAIQFSISATGALVPVYYYWVRDTNTIFVDNNKTLADSIVSAYIQNPVGSGISYMAPLLQNVYGLYNSSEYINANDTVLHIGYATGTNDDVSHEQFNLIRDGYPDDFLSGVPLNSNLLPDGLYDRLLDSMCGVDETGAVVPNPYLPKLVQTGVLARPRQSFFYNRFIALKNYLQYSNSILAKYPITEIRQNLSFLFQKNPAIYETILAGNCQAGIEYTIVDVGLIDWTQLGAASNTIGEVFIATGPAAGEYRNTGTASFLAFQEGEKYDTADYWEYINWWAPGYDNNTKSKLQVALYADLSTLSVVAGSIVTVATNDSGRSETYLLEPTGNWKRIGLANGTIKFKSSLWDYSSVRLGYGDNFFDTDTYDVYPSEETRYITRALTEQIYTEDLLLYRNKSLVLLFEYIQSETSENQNYLPWLNKTSFIDVSHTIRELRPIEVFQTDNQDFLAGYLNEVKPYHVVIKEFLFKYTGEEVFAGNITDFDLPSKYDSSIRQFVTPQLVNENPSGPYQFLPTDPIWEEPEYAQWFANRGVAITGQSDVEITTLASYISLNTDAFSVDNASGLPINGILTLGTEKIGYSTVDRALNVVSGLTRGVDGTPVATHNPGALIYIDLPAVLLLDSGRGYVEPPKIVAYIDTTLYPPPTRPAVLKAVMNLDSVLRVDVEDPGQGYMVLPQIIIDPATVITFSSSDVNTASNTIRLYAPLLQTTDLIQYKVGSGNQPIGGLQNNQWYYVNVLETTPSVVVGLYTNYADSINDHDRIRLYTSGTGTTHTLNLGAKASAISSSTPTRENNITLRFDRTSYTSQVIEWIAGRYYGAYYAGSYYNSEAVASSSITLQSTQPPISDILASAQGVAFEITDVRNDRIITYSSFLRQVESTQSSNNSVRLQLQDDGSGNPNASGGTNGFYIGMPVKFIGAVGSSGLISTVQVYYVNSIINQTDFTISLDPSGTPAVLLSNHTISAAGLTCEVGEVTDTAVLTVNYPGILNVTATEAITNKLTVPLNSTGTGGTLGFYINLPIFFTGTVYGGITENRTYYITTVVDSETFTISENQNPKTFNVLATTTGTNTITIDGDTSQLDINEPVIFNTMLIAGVESTTFGSLTSGATYYVSSIVNPSSFTVSTLVNGSVYPLTTIAPASDTSTLMTSQEDTVILTTASGNNMVMNVSLPVSPGQVNGQLFTLYETSGQIPNVTGTDSNLITRHVSAFIGVRTIDSSPVNVYRIALTNFNSGVNVSLGLTNIYINMPIEVSATVGTSFLQAGTTYYVAEKGIIEVEVTSTSSSGNMLTCDTTESLYENMPILFSGAGIGGVEIDVEYIVKRVVDDHRFTITNTPGGIEIVVTTSSGLMTGTGLPYVKVTTDVPGTPSPTIVDPGDTQQTASISIGTPAVITVAEAPNNLTTIILRTSGSLPAGISSNTPYYVRNATGTTFNISLTPGGTLVTSSGTQSGVHTMLITTDITVDQTPTSTPIFDVSYILGGYRAIISNSGSGYAVDNTITIPGTDIGGSNPLNNLILTVNSIGINGEITGIICNGIVSGESNQYYLKVISPNEFALYSNQLMTVPVSGLTLPYVGITVESVTYINSANDSFTIADTSVFDINDAIVFTGDIPTILTNPFPGGSGLVLGQTYYIYQIISGTEFSICSVPGDVSTLIQIVTSIAVDITIAKSGSFALLPEPFIFNQSIVKYNNRVYVCIISNNDTEFVFGKWQLLTSGDRRLNAMDRTYGYYQPTINMPGKDLTQLFDGVTYPNSTYLGNPFEPAAQFEVDTILQDQPFYPTEVNVASVVWDGQQYFAAANMPAYTSVITSADTAEWEIDKLANTLINATDITYSNGIYIVTTNNPATPVFRSQDGIVWSTNGYYTPYSATPYDDTNYDMTALDVSSLSLNSVAFGADIWVAVGQNIVSSTDTYIWRERLAFTNPLLINEWFGVDYISIPYFTGFVAVGKGQELDYSTGVGTAVNVDLVAISSDGISWNLLTSFSTQGLYGIADNNSTIISVGENGVIYISVDGNRWTGINRTGIVSVNGSTDTISVINTTGLSVNTPIQFNNAFDIVTTGTTYYVKTLISDTQIQITDAIGNPAINLTGAGIVPVNTELYIYPTTATLRDVYYASNKFIAVGDDGLIKQSSDGGTTWTVTASGTLENLNGITYNVDDSSWIIVGDNNTILISLDNGVTWTNSSIFAAQTTTYDVQGAEFTYGYGPEELVPGIVTDNVNMIVATRPGSNWDETIYQHVGYNVVSIELTPQSGTQLTYSFDVGSQYDIQNAAQISVYILNGTTELGTAIYAGLDYTIDWVNFTITLASPLPYTPITDKLRIDIYEVGNGNQLVKASTNTDPIRINTTTGWNEIYVNCNYTGQIYQGSGVIRPGTSPSSAIASETDSISNTILCDDVSGFLINEPILFQGTTFGGILEDTVYYVKSISYITSRITVSLTFNTVAGTAGPTLPLSTDSGTMTAVIQIGTGAVWTDPIIYHNGSKLILGHASTVTRTKSSANTIVCNTTESLIVGEPIVFSATMFGTDIDSGNIIAGNFIIGQTYKIVDALDTNFISLGASDNNTGTTFVATGTGTGTGIATPVYYVKTIVDGNEFTVSRTAGGSILTLADATGGAEYITNDYTFGIADNGISAAIRFSVGYYDNTVDYLTYTLFGETTPVQYGYTIPETQLFTYSGTSTFAMDNYNGGDNPTNAIVELNGLRLTASDYTIDDGLDSITITAAMVPGDTVAVTTYNLTERQYLNTQYGLTNNTVAKITEIDNEISTFNVTVNITETNAGTDEIIAVSTSGMSVGQTVIFKAASSIANIAIDGTVYYIHSIISGTNFKISSTPGGGVFDITSSAVGLMVACVGGLPAVRITTITPHGFVSPTNNNNLVRIDGVIGSTQLNNNTYYVHVINSTQVDLYDTPYDPSYGATNSPVTAISSYVSGGYIWGNNSFTLVTTVVTQTETDPILGNRLTVSSTDMLVPGTPIIFTGTALGGISLNTTYYVKSVSNATKFTIAATRTGEEVVLTNDSGSMDATQWEQDNVDRLWVTLNGYRIPSSSLYLNANNELSILTSITTSDEIIITSMMPSATPNEEVYLLGVNQQGSGVTYRANTQTRTWLVQPLGFADTVIYVNDVSRLTDTLIQTNIVPAAVDGVYTVGLDADKRIICSVSVYNNTTGLALNSADYELSIESIAPVLKITSGVSMGNSITITVIEGSLIYVHGEQIKFTQVDLITNTLSGIQRGVNGTGIHDYISLYTELYGILSNNQMSTADYLETWNSYVYNTTDGDPLQISRTEPAIFLRGDIN